MVILLEPLTRCLGLFAVLIVIGCNSTEPEDRYETAVKAFASSVPTDKTAAAIDLIKSADIDAFDTLLAHLDDETRASEEHFMRAMVVVDENGNEGPYEPSVGDACFDLLQAQIEGGWPKGFREYYVLNRINIRDWLDQRKGKTLRELRIECATLSLASAKRDHQINPTEWTDTCVKFLTQNLTAIQSED